MKDNCYRLWPFWAPPDEIVRITNALVIGILQHQTQRRKYNEVPYIVHPIRVALSLASYPQVKLFWISAALLHDTIEDTVHTPEEVLSLKNRITSECGGDVLKLVEELTNEEHDKHIPRRQRKALDRERLSKVSQAAKIIKMLDRIDNLRDMVGAPIDFKKLYVQESEELLRVVGDGDDDISHQLKTTIGYVYSWRNFNPAELAQKPKGTVFEHTKRGLCFVEEAGPRGHMKFSDNNACFAFNGPIADYNPFSSIMRETGGRQYEKGNSSN